MPEDHYFTHSNLHVLSCLGHFNISEIRVHFTIDLTLELYWGFMSFFSFLVVHKKMVHLTFNSILDPRKYDGWYYSS